WHFRPGLDAFLLPDHLADFLVEVSRLDARGVGGVLCQRVRPYPMRRIPPVASFLQLVYDGLAGLLLELDRHLAILFALKQPNASEIVARNAEGVGSGRPLPLSYSLGKALGFGCRRLSDGGGFSLWFLIWCALL